MAALRETGPLAPLPSSGELAKGCRGDFDHGHEGIQMHGPDRLLQTGRCGPHDVEVARNAREVFPEAVGKAAEVLADVAAAGPQVPEHGLEGRDLLLRLMATVV